MFKCMIPGSTNPNDQNWETATYISSTLENGFNVGIQDAPTLLYLIKPFTEDLFQRTFYQDRIIRDYAFRFIIEIRTKGELVRVGEFYFQSSRNPFNPKVEGLELNRDLSPYLEHPYKILVTTNFVRSHVMVIRFLEAENDEESVPPKPLEKTFKSDQCVICLEEEPKVLFCNCGHICICEKCILHRYDNCPVCKKENTILRMIE